ncbi:MAG: ribonuclease P protein component [Bdellovibrionales bacterium]|nr:ribonuclease P protein component [Bdellovibrionales bacterium]
MWISLNKKKDFILLRKKGKYLKTPGFFIIYRKNGLSSSRIALFFPKWTGKAVQRNKFKRWARHFVAKQKWREELDILLGFEKREKSFYKNMKYHDFYTGFERVSKYIEL